MSLFDGKQGRSDGTKDGISSSLPTGKRNIAVHGAFDGATVTLQRYSKASDSWFDTQASWTSSDVFQGLDVTSDAKYRLDIDSAGAGTNIVAEV